MEEFVVGFLIMAFLLTFYTARKNKKKRKKKEAQKQIIEILKSRNI